MIPVRAVMMFDCQWLFRLAGVRCLAMDQPAFNKHGDFFFSCLLLKARKVFHLMTRRCFFNEQ